MDLDNLTLQGLRDLKEKVALEIKTREAQSIQEARARIQEIATGIGIPLNELFSKQPKKYGPAPVRYRHPDDAEKEWSGRGRAPKWVKEWQDGGKSLDALRIG